jgi:radical SAM protein with 4Fe4S-binding SPASM domain
LQIKNSLDLDFVTKDKLRRIATFQTSKSLSDSTRGNLLSPLEEEKIKRISTAVSKPTEASILSPTIVRIYLSSFCQHNCPGCFHDRSPITSKKFLSVGDFRKLLDDLLLLDIQMMDLTGGGEPTLHPQFIEFVKMCRDEKIKLALLSNGTWKDPRLIDLLADRFSFVRVNLDASSEEIYERLHRPPIGGEFQRMMNNLEMLIGEREKRKSALIVGAKVRLNQINMNYVEEMITLSRDLGLDYIQFQMQRKVPEELLAEQRRNVDEIIRELESRHQSLLILGEPHEGQTGDWCRASQAQLTINASGDVYSCPHFREHPNASYLGNLLRQSWHDLWLEFNKKCERDPASLKTCPVENCRWRFYDDMIQKRTIF